MEVFRDYFAVVSSIDDVTDESLALQLSSRRGKHQKRGSLMDDENFRKEAKQYVLDDGYVKGKPNLTLQ